MVYKKYIVKNGKSYGPYIYHSKRVNGKVVSEYCGQKKNNYTKFLLFGAGFLLIAFLFYFILFIATFTGKVTLGLDANYSEGQPLTGVLRLSLRQGELLPATSKIILETNSQVFEYFISDITSESTTQGNFYVEGKDISGSGKGYGIPGEKKSYPHVSFTLNLISQSSSEVPETPTSETPNETIPEAPRNENQSETIPESEIVPETPIEEVSPAPEVPVEETPITGSIISRLITGISKMFLGLLPTGKVTAEIQSQITGTTSVDKPFTYTLSEGQSAELSSSSHNVEVSTNNGIVSVTTDYSEKEEGFGEDYLGDKTKVITFNISELNITPEAGSMKIKLVYEDSEILTLNTVLSEGNVNASEQTEIIMNQTLNQTIENQTFETSNISLTENEMEILQKTFGNFSVEVIKAEKINDRVVIRFKLGEYWAEFSYSSDSKVQDLMEKDKVRWLKDLAKKLLTEEEKPEVLDGFLGNYTITNSNSQIESNASIEEENLIVEVNSTEEVNLTQ